MITIPESSHDSQRMQVGCLGMSLIYLQMDTWVSSLFSTPRLVIFSSLSPLLLTSDWPLMLSFLLLLAITMLEGIVKSAAI